MITEVSPRRTEQKRWVMIPQGVWGIMAWIATLLEPITTATTLLARVAAWAAVVLVLAFRAGDREQRAACRS